MLRNLKFILPLICLAVAGNTLGQQANPTVEIVLSQPTAQIGDTITADVYVRNTVNLAGIDIGLSVDETCLEIRNRDAGDLIPTTAEAGGSSGFSELNPYNTRLAAALVSPEPSELINGDGVFYRVTLSVTCNEGIAPLSISYALFTGVVDPSVEDVRFVNHDLAEGTVTTVNTELAIVPAGQVTAVGTTVTESTPVDDATPAPVVAENPSQTSMLTVAGLVLIGVGLLGIIFLLVYLRRSRRR